MTILTDLIDGNIEPFVYSVRSALYDGNAICMWGSGDHDDDRITDDFDWIIKYYKEDPDFRIFQIGAEDDSNDYADKSSKEWKEYIAEYPNVHQAVVSALGDITEEQALYLKMRYDLDCHYINKFPSMIVNGRIVDFNNEETAAGNLVDVVEELIPYKNSHEFQSRFDSTKSAMDKFEELFGYDWATGKWAA